MEILNPLTKDLTGTRFGSVVVLEYAGRRLGPSRGAKLGRLLVPFWTCRCDCGSTVVINGRRLKTAKRTKCGSRSCAALFCKTRRQAGRRVLSNYKQSAQTRGIDWNLTEDEFFSLITQPCHYSGMLPKKPIKTVEGTFYWNGVDRKDSSLGYTIDNCVPCSHFANTAKLDHPYDEFVDWMKQAAQFWQQKDLGV